MPTYNFECENGHEMEYFVQVPSKCPPSIQCEKCEKRAHKVFSVGQKPYFRMPGGVKYSDGSGI
jgi:predicted nucleic acid-binding Zn ribbon protein